MSDEQVHDVTNPPGRSTLDRRVGTSAQFAATMAARLTRQDELEAFTNRRDDDPAIALVHAWSAVLDVLGFYSERLASEAYLRTAVDPRSLTELAHSVGYQPGRGRASATELAFTLEDAPGAPSAVPIPAATKVASLPAPDEVPQTYETTAPLDARPPWNAMLARATEPERILPGATGAYVDGVRSDLAVGDAVLFVGSEREAAPTSERWAFRRLSSVRADATLGATRITWVEPLGSPAASSGRQQTESVPAARDLRIFVLREQAAVFGAAAPDHRLINESAGGGRADPRARGETSAKAPSPGLPTTVPDHHQQIKDHVLALARDWPGWTVAVDKTDTMVDLDRAYPEAVTGGWAVLVRSGATAAYRIEGTTEEARTDYTLNARVTRLTVSGPGIGQGFDGYVRQTSVWVGSELVPLAGSPVAEPVQGLEVALARRVPTPPAGKVVVVRGPRPVVRVAEGRRTLRLVHPSRPDVALHPGDVLEVVGPVTANADGSSTWVTTEGTVTAPRGALETVARDADAPVLSEVAEIASSAPDQPDVDRLRFAASLRGCYDRAAVRILGNVAHATHGETRQQVLGSGSATTPYQRFRLSGTPLTHVLAGSGGAVLSTLDVRVDGRSWREVPRLFGSGPHDEVYTTSADDEGTVTVRFGDGLTGSRVPTGTNNVTATYRVGTGVAGRVAADQLTMPMTRPLGLRSVTNPLPSGLAADPEPPDLLRANTPRTALILERVVSLRDVEDFARGVPGIGAALATRLWNGRTRFVHLTVAGTGGQAVDAQALADLKAAVLSAGDARLPLVVDAAEVVEAPVAVSVVVDPAYDVQTVHEGVRASVAGALGIDRRSLGQPLRTGDVILAAHRVRGVVAVHVTRPADDVPALSARVSGGVVLPAQLVMPTADGPDVTEASS